MDKYEKALEQARNYYPDNQFLDMIFPELAEDEGGRQIKKFMQELSLSPQLQTALHQHGLSWRMLSRYLEKQKEQKSRIDACGFPLREEGESACSYLERCLATDMRNVWYEACSEIKEKQKEQKPAENPQWYDSIDEFYADLEKQKEQKGSLQVIKDASEWEKIKEQKPAEWSEEDDACYKLILKELEHYKESHPDYSRHFSRLIEWFTTRFKSLRPQQKQDGVWITKEQFEQIKSASYLTGKLDQWKPSEEQRRSLEFAIKQLERNYLIGPGRAEDKALYQLVNDLKKLM